MSKLFFIFILLFSHISVAQNANQMVFETSVPFVVHGKTQNEIQNEVQVKIQNEKLLKIKTQDYIKIREKLLKIEILQKKEINQNLEWLSIDDLDFEISYNPTDATIVAKIPETLLRPDPYSLDIPPETRYKGLVTNKAPFGGAINFQLEKTFAPDQLGGDTFASFFDSFVNLKGVVLENKTNYYHHSQTKKWFRGDTRLIKDFKSMRIRTQLGDVSPRNLGFMSAGPMGGIMASRDFSLNPYKFSYPRSGGEFVVQGRSRVKTMVNGMVIKDEYLAPGTYKLDDLPLRDGLNRIQVEVVDDFGNKTIYEYSLPAAVSLLAKGEWDFSVGIGKPYSDNMNHRKYQNDISGHLLGLYGITEHVTVGAYGQFEDRFRLLGGEFGVSSLVGNFFLGLASSHDKNDKGEAASLSWQWQNMGNTLFTNVSTTLRQEVFSKGFKRQNLILPEGLKSNTQFNIMIPIQNMAGVSVGTSKGFYHDKNLGNRTSYDATLSMKVLKNINLSLFLSRAREQYGTYNDTAYLYLTWDLTGNLTGDFSGDLTGTFDNSNNYLTLGRDFENKSGRLSFTKDNNNELYNPKINVNLDDGPKTLASDIETHIQTPFADFKARLMGLNDRQHEGTTKTRNSGGGSLSLSSSLAFGYNDNSWAIGLARPIQNSFVIFKPTEKLKGQTIGLMGDATSFKEKTGLFGEVIYGQLLPYLYSELQLDPSYLDDGLSLQKEKFIIYPEYKSVHQIILKGKGALTLKGRLLNSKGEPYTLKVGHIGAINFFTDRQGYFYIESVRAGTYKLGFNDSHTPILIHIGHNEIGIKDLGSLVIE